jgi:hypothetical protein
MVARGGRGRTSANALIVHSSGRARSRKRTPGLRRVVKLEKELAEFTSGEWHKGVWDDRQYKKGNVVTHQGSTWIARDDTSTKPGTDPAWQLIVKRGRDGRDAP